MLIVTVTMSDAIAYDKWRPDTSLRDHPYLLQDWLAGTTNPDDEDAWSQFVENNPPPDACCLYFIEISIKGQLPHLLYIGSVFRQSAHDRLKTHHVNAKLVYFLQKFQSIPIAIRYGDIEAADYDLYQNFTEGKPEKNVILPPDPEPLWTFPEDEQENVIRDVEAALIFKLKPEFNKRNKNSYRGYPIHIVLQNAPWTDISTERSFSLKSER